MRDRQHERKATRPDSKTSSAGKRRPRRTEIPASIVNTFSQCFEYAALGLSVTDLEGRLLDVNAAYCSMTGYTESELRQRVNLQTLIHPADLPNALEKMRALVAGEIPAFIVEQRYLKQDGSIAWVQNNVSLIRNKAGQPASIAWLTQDISERKRAQDSLAALEESRTARNAAEQKYQQIFENAGEGIFQSTPEGRYLTANPALARMHGFDSPAELIDSRQDISREIYVEPTQREEFKRLLEEHRSVQGFEHETIRKDGVKIWISVNAHAIRDDAGSILYYEGTAQDITERKRAEQALRESEERYRDLVENSRELICTHDLDGTILSVNRSARTLFGYELHEFVGLMNIRDILEPEVRDEFNMYMQRILNEGATSGTMLIQTRSGDHRVLEYYNSLRTEGVAAPIVRGIARDITETRKAEQALRESEERYRELFENSKDPIYVHDMNGIYTSVNRAAEKLSGYSREQIVGKHFSEFMTSQHAQHVQRQLQKKLESAGETTYEIEMITKKGRSVPIEISSRLILEAGVPVGVQGCIRDISEKRKAQEAERNYSRRVIEAQEAERRRISRELHDQVGQILTAVKMNLHALQHKCTQPEILVSINENLKVIDEAVDQIRDLSVDLRPLLLDDLGLVVALRWYLERQTRNLGIPAKFVSGSLDEDDRFSSELETACFRIVQEGVTNIVRHARATRISVRLERVVSDLILLITDDGAGFDSRMLRSGSGTATLGLRGMEERAQAVGGTITIDSAPALGTEICARFPMKGEKRRDADSKTIEFAAKA
ncbi:MAG TPA: PAS domain S-box protein [Pyrinomonadaceae bacterium]|jgi:PAS domain S-box-containing protein|nr:PAS domain S-box protein [Pyrinomonadaceae bacterium]